MVLDGWDSSKVVKLQIDHTKIDEDLTDFPILIKLSATSGVTATPCTSILDEFPTTTTSGSIDTRDAYVKLLVQSGSVIGDTDIVDHSASPKAVTVVGLAQTCVALTPLLNNRYAINFNGVGDYLSIASNSDFNLAGNDFTIELWFYPVHIGAHQRVIYRYNGTSGWGVNINNTNTISFTNNSGATVSMTSTNTINSLLGTWVHLALVRYGNNYDLYINGVSWASTVVAGSITDIATPVCVGRAYATQAMYDFYGMMQDITISPGIARYTTAFTPPTQTIYDNRTYYNSTAPAKLAVVQPAVQEHWVSPTKTVFLLHSDTISGSTTFTDSSGYNNTITPYGSVIHTTDAAKFGTTAIKFDGSSDALYTGTSNFWNFGTDAFTIDFWYRPIAKTNLYPVVFQIGGAGWVAGVLNFIDRHSGYPNCFLVQYGTSYDHLLQSVTNPQDGVWYHIALVRSGANFSMYVNGTLEASVGTFYYPINAASSFLILGMQATGTANTALNGYIDEFRVVRGATAWTSNFTPPTAAYTNDPEWVSTTLSGGDTQLYCEVDAWKAHGRTDTAYLWVKVPKIFSNQPTDLLLYYDSNHADNNSYVGTTGTSAAKNVWTEYIAVYHSTGDTVSGTGQILDSTANSLHGEITTGYGHSILYTDSYGFWLECLGSNRCVRCKTYTGSISGGIGLEAIVRPANTATTRIMAIGGETNYTAITLYTDGMLSSYNGTSWTCNQLKPSTINGAEYYHAASWDGVIARAIQWYNYIPLYLSDTSEAFPNITTKYIKLGMSFDTATAYKLYGRAKEFRILNSNKTDAWFKATYYSLEDDLITYTFNPPIYKVSGYITQQQVPVQRQVCLYHRTTGQLMGRTVSDATGFYYLETTSSGAHNLVCYDADDADNYSDIIVSKVYPTEAV